MKSEIRELTNEFWNAYHRDDYMTMDSAISLLSELHHSCTQPEIKTSLGEQIKVMQRKLNYLYVLIDRGFDRVDRRYFTE